MGCLSRDEARRMRLACRRLAIQPPLPPPLACRHHRLFSSHRHHPAAGAKRPELYALLDVDTAAAPVDIKAGFLRQARRHHPDISSEQGAAELFQRIHRAMVSHTVCHTCSL